ncbi:MAG: TrkA family potassium uptake protein [Candidatus Korobacteraceae bacterium]
MSAAMKGLRNLRLLGALLLALMAAGMTGYHFIEGWSWFDSLYMVVMTVTTIGYGEVHPLSPAGRAFNLFIMAGGVGLVLLMAGALAAALLEFELHSFFGRRRMQRDIERLTGHYIICGAGRVGRSAARELARKPAPFVIVESNPAKAERLPPDWLVYLGDATQESTLHALHIEHARGLVAATTTDATNLYIILTARGLNPLLKIVARASEEDAEKHMLNAGASSVILPYTFAGHRIAQSFLRPNVLDFLDVATAGSGMRNLEIEEVLVDERSQLAGTTIATSKIRQEHGVIVLAIKGRSGMRFNPQPQDSIEAGDYLIAMGEPEGLRRLEGLAATPA